MPKIMQICPCVLKIWIVKHRGPRFYAPHVVGIKEIVIQQSYLYRNETGSHTALTAGCIAVNSIFLARSRNPGGNMGLQNPKFEILGLRTLAQDCNP